MSELRITDGARDLRAYLDDVGISIPVFSSKHGFDRIHVQRVLNGERWRRITVDFAHAVEKATGGRVVWTRWLSKTGRKPVAKAA